MTDYQEIQPADDAPALEVYPALPLRDIVIFPHMVAPLFVGREKSIRALEQAVRDDAPVLLVTQKDPAKDEPQAEDLYQVGALGSVLQLLKLPDGTMKVLVEGRRRLAVTDFSLIRPESDEDSENGASGEYLLAATREIPEPVENPEKLLVLARTLQKQFARYAGAGKRLPGEIVEAAARITDPSKLADTIAQHLSLKIADKQDLLETASVSERLEKLFNAMESEISIMRMEKRIRGRVKKQMEKTQREYYLNEQIKAIQKELGENGDGGDELSALEKKIAKTRLSKEARTKAEAELKKLRAMSPMSAESAVIRNYLDWILSIPWKRASRVRRDLVEAEQVLNADHFGLEKVKERILEHLSVQARMKKVKGPILCLVGPPGVGKTSLGRSIAAATNRQFVRMSLGGVRDESEIRGHRRTYVGSMPGRIIQGMKKAGSSNPVFLLDEVDKLGADWRGDPSSALLEVLDPEQNNSFSDHYLEVDYDLSDVMFVTTSNSLNMPQPLRDRMEIIRIPGYTEGEKLEIAKRHLIPRQIRDNGLKKTEWSIDDAALLDLIRYYTREAGVRSLERELANLCRKGVKKIMMKEVESIRITSENLADFAGVRKHRHGETEDKDQIGVCTGLAWTEVGGELLSIESVMAPGKGKAIRTGKLGDVMQESVAAAESYIKSRAASLGIRPTLFEKTDIHLHVPEGATPKDGPSAGVAMVVSMVSALTRIPVRRDVAMTGEITLRGRVLGIGGLKEKLLAALRGGVKTVLIPSDNEKDLAEIPQNVLEGLKIVPVQTVDEVLKNALVTPIQPIEWTPEAAAADKISPADVQGAMVAH